MKPSFATAGKVRLAWYARGDGFPVLLIMGLGGRAADWGEVVPSALATRFRVISFDNRGTGASDKPDEEYHLEVMADEAMAVLDAAGASRAHVVGISMGGMIAQLVALRNPGRVERLALLSTTTGGAAATPPSPEAARALLPDRSRPAAEIVRTAMGLVTAPGFAGKHPQVIEDLVRIALAAPTPGFVFARQLAAVMASDRSARLREIEAPTLVLHGDADPLVPYGNAVALQSRILGARLTTLAGSGHLPMWEKPDETAAALLDFLG